MSVSPAAEGGFFVPEDMREELLARHLFDFTLWIGRALVRARLLSPGEVAAKTDGELLALPGIGPARLRQIRSKLGRAA